MPRGKKLSVDEQKEILIKKGEGMSKYAIAKDLNRSLTVVTNFLNDPQDYGKMVSTGRPKVITPSIGQRIKRVVMNDPSCSSSDVIRGTGIEVSKRTVQRFLKSTDFSYKKKLHAPRMTQAHKNARVTFAHLHQTWSADWRRVVFSDEKKFNLDGPDGLQYYWHHVSQDQLSYKKRNFGGGSVMVWGAFCYNGTLPLMTITARMNSSDYIKMLGDVHLKEAARSLCGNNFLFQQDNASIHRSMQTQRYLSNNTIPVMTWPALSPDLNPIENVWGCLARAVYKNGRQFNTTTELNGAIQLEWSRMDKDYLKTLVNSMPDRIFQVINRNGNKADY